MKKNNISFENNNTLPEEGDASGGDTPSERNPEIGPQIPLPAMYKNPNDNDVYWICDYDQDQKITSVFVGHGEKYCSYLPNFEEVYKQEMLLKNEGWVKCKKPEITVTFDEKTLPRKYKRELERQKKKEEKKQQKKEKGKN